MSGYFGAAVFGVGWEERPDRLACGGRDLVGPEDVSAAVVAELDAQVLLVPDGEGFGDRGLKERCRHELPRAIWMLDFFYIDGCPVGKHFRGSAHQFVGIVAGSDDCVGPELGGV